MILKNVLLLGGLTARSQAYAQIMEYGSLGPEHVIVYGPEKPVLPGQVQKQKVSCQKISSDIPLPNLEVPLLQTCNDNKWPIERLVCENINDKEIFNIINRMSPSLVIYSGYGSQIVGNELLNMDIPFLHMHSGWLPEYRGSTTLYYTWIKEGVCGVSAILLRQGIDTGPIVAQKHYPPPGKGIDPDYLYDCAIRADLLLSVLQSYSRDGLLPEAKKQSGKGTTYYVIHPVLKHIARLQGESNSSNP